MTSPNDFVVKGSADLVELAGGMVRSSAAGKIDFTLAFDGVMLQRWAQHLTRATQPPASYPKRNWLKAGRGTPEDKAATLERYRESAARHFIQWLQGQQDEDHASAVFFNINGYETLRTTENA